jgi:hypothetical protein
MKSELKYFDFDAGIDSNIGATLMGYNDGSQPWNGTPMSLTNYPTAYSNSPASINNVRRGIFIINKITQGTDIFQRIGREVIMKSLYLRVEITALTNSWYTTVANSVNTGWGTGVRIMVLYDTQTNNVAETSVTLDQILKLTGNAAAGSIDTYASGYMTAFQNLDYRDRWNVILDKVYDIGNTNGINSKTIKIYKKFGKGGLPVTYTGNTGTTINTGALWFLIGGSQADAPATAIPAADKAIKWNYFMTSRIRYTDS